MTAVSHLYAVSVCILFVEVVTYVVKRAFDRTIFSAVWSRTAPHSGNMQGKCASVSWRADIFVLICFWTQVSHTLLKCPHVPSTSDVLKLRLVLLVLAQMTHSVFSV